jgi:hypothetical protein
MKFMILLALIVALFAPFPPGLGHGGTYNTFSGVYWCSSDYVCNHEYAHWLDHHQNWVSSSPEYQKAFSDFISAGNDQCLMFRAVVRLEGSDWREIYADLYAIYGGRPPPNFYEFYPQVETLALCAGNRMLTICRQIAK